MRNFIFYSRADVRANDLFNMTQRIFKSLAEAVETYYEELLSFARKRTGSDTLAEDVIQDTWIKANKANVVMPDNPRAYLYRMTGNLVIDHLRKRQSVARIEMNDTAEYASHDEHDAGWPELAISQTMDHQAPELEETMSSRQELDILINSLQELPESCRKIFLLYRGHGMTMRAIAEELDVSVRVVERQIARAMLHCRATLREAGRDV